MILELMNGFWVPPACGLFWGLMFSLIMLSPMTRHRFWWYTLWPSVSLAVTSLFPAHNWWAPWNEPGAIFWLALSLYHLNRKRRDRAKVWLGAKSRALRDALVRKARELSQPRPVLQPVPQ